MQRAKFTASGGRLGKCPIAFVIATAYRPCAARGSSCDDGEDRLTAFQRPSTAPTAGRCWWEARAQNAPTLVVEGAARTIFMRSGAALAGRAREEVPAATEEDAVDAEVERRAVAVRSTAAAAMVASFAARVLDRRVIEGLQLAIDSFVTAVRSPHGRHELGAQRARRANRFVGELTLPRRDSRGPG